jgi:hypothetical protein
MCTIVAPDASNLLRNLVSSRHAALRRQFVYDVRKLSAKCAQQVYPIHPGMLAQGVDVVSAQGFCELLLGDVLVRAGADPGVRLISVSALLKLLKQCAETTREGWPRVTACEQVAQAAAQ